MRTTGDMGRAPTFDRPAHRARAARAALRGLCGLVLLPLARGGDAVAVDPPPNARASERAEPAPAGLVFFDSSVHGFEVAYHWKRPWIEHLLGLRHSNDSRAVTLPRADLLDRCARGRAGAAPVFVLAGGPQVERADPQSGVTRALVDACAARRARRRGRADGRVPALRLAPIADRFGWVVRIGHGEMDPSLAGSSGARPRPRSATAPSAAATC